MKTSQEQREADLLAADRRAARYLETLTDNWPYFRSWMAGDRRAEVSAHMVPPTIEALAAIKESLVVPGTARRPPQAGSIGELRNLVVDLQRQIRELRHDLCGEVRTHAVVILDQEGRERARLTADSDLEGLQTCRT